MKLIQWMKAGKRIFCCLLVLVLTAGQSVPLVYAEDIEKSSVREAEKTMFMSGVFISGYMMTGMRKLQRTSVRTYVTR